VTEVLDAETREALQWYMEQCHPDWYPKKAKVKEGEA
jgi:hypothetical protein